MKILYFSTTEGNSGSRLEGLRRLGHEVALVPGYPRGPLTKGPRLLRAAEWRLCNGPGTWLMNRALVKAARAFQPEFTWVEMGKLIYPSSIRAIKKLGSFLMNSYSDDFLEPSHFSPHYNRSIPLYDYIITPRDINIDEYRKYGAQRVGKFWKGFDPNKHYPQELTPQQRQLYGADIVFVGHWEPERSELLTELREHVESMKVWGPNWAGKSFPPKMAASVQGRGAKGEEYRLALCGGRIAIQPLCKMNRDTQTCRSFEVPACGVMMLAERSEDHLACFEEDKEAVFFSDQEELIDKAKYYLAHEDQRAAIAAAGRQRCLRSGYSNWDRAKQFLDDALAGQAEPAPAGSGGDKAAAVLP